MLRDQCWRLQERAMFEPNVLTRWLRQHDDMVQAGYFDATRAKDGEHLCAVMP